MIPAPAATARHTIAPMVVANDRRVLEVFNPPLEISPVSCWASGSPYRGQLRTVAALAASGNVSLQGG